MHFYHGIADAIMTYRFTSRIIESNNIKESTLDKIQFHFHSLLELIFLNTLHEHKMFQTFLKKQLIIA